MKIHEVGELALTNFKPAKENKRAKPSDHALMELELGLKFYKQKPTRTEVFNFKNTNCQEVFFDKTNETKDLSKIFEEDGDVEKQTQRWWSKLNSFFHQSFKKVRVKDGRKTMLTDLDKKMDEWNIVKKKNKVAKNSGESNPETEQEEENLEQEIATTIDDLNLKVVKETLGVLHDGSGLMNRRGLWNLKKKVNPKVKPTLPMGKKNLQGQIITNPKELKDLYLQTFLHRLRNRPIKKGYEGIIDLQNELFKIRIESAKLKKTAPWKMTELEVVLKKIKKDKARDPEGLINELFKPGVIGDDLKLSLLLMFNKIKDQGTVPDLLKKANISAIPKKKGSRLEIENERGIFICSVFRNILMRLVYGDKYDSIDDNMSDSNVGSRKNKSIRNHLFVLNAVINDVMSSNKKTPIEVQQMDFRQMFDSEQPTQCLNALFESGVDDDHLVMINEANKNNSIAVKTPSGEISERANIKENIMQGEVMAPLISSNLVDKFGKECMENKEHLYLFKDKVEIPPLGLVDDLILISDCGYKTTKINTFINSKTNMSKLYFSAEKCKQMHVGKMKNETLCKNLEVEGWEEKVAKNKTTGKYETIDVEVGPIKMKTTEETKYLGSIIQSNGSNEKEINARAGRGTGLTNEIMNILQSIVFGRYHFEAAIILRNSILLGSMLTSSECWLGLTQKQVRKLEMVDEMLLERVLEAPSYSSRALLYLSLGLVPIRFILMQKRLLFLQYILHEKEESLIHQTLKAILEDPKTNDFGNQIKKDLESFNLELGMEEIKAMSKYAFKNIIKENMVKAAMQYLSEKKDKQEKIRNLEINNLEIQNFLRADGVETIKLSTLTHNLWAQTIEIKEHNPWNYSDNLCICELKAETQIHIFHCDKLKSENEVLSNSVQYQNLYFGTAKQKAEIAIMFKNKLKRRREIMDENQKDKEIEQEEEEIENDAGYSPSALGTPVEP